MTSMAIRVVEFSNGGYKILYPPFENSTTRIAIMTSAQIYAFIVGSKNIENKGTERLRVRSKIVALSWCIIFWDYFWI